MNRKVGNREGGGEREELLSVFTLRYRISESRNLLRVTDDPIDAGGGSFIGPKEWTPEATVTSF